MELSHRIVRFQHLSGARDCAQTAVELQHVSRDLYKPCPRRILTTAIEPEGSAKGHLPPNQEDLAIQ